MEDFVNNFYNVSVTHPLTHEDSGLSLVYVKYILDILSPLFLREVRLPLLIFCISINL